MLQLLARILWPSLFEAHPVNTYLLCIITRTCLTAQDQEPELSASQKFHLQTVCAKVVSPVVHTRNSNIMRINYLNLYYRCHDYLQLRLSCSRLVLPQSSDVVVPFLYSVEARMVRVHHLHSIEAQVQPGMVIPKVLRNYGNDPFTRRQKSENQEPKLKNLMGVLGEDMQGLEMGLNRFRMWFWRTARRAVG